MVTKKYLKVENGNVKSVTASGVVQRSYYTNGDAVRADWEDEVKESVQVQLKNGKILLISGGGVLIRSF